MKKLFTLLIIISSINAFEIKIDKSMKPLYFYRDNSKQVVIDIKRKLMWQDNKKVNTTKLNWKNARNYCRNLNFAGYSDWRLPTENELLSITDDTIYNPAIKKEFKYVRNNYYWSSTPNISSSRNSMWNVNFYDGYDYYYYEIGKYYVRCVRNSK